MFSFYFIIYRQGQRIAPGRSTPMSAGYVFSVVTVYSMSVPKNECSEITVYL